MLKYAVLLKEVLSHRLAMQIYRCMLFAYDFVLSGLSSQEEYLDWDAYEGEINIRLITKV